PLARPPLVRGSSRAARSLPPYRRSPRRPPRPTHRRRGAGSTRTRSACGRADNPAGRHADAGGPGPGWAPESTGEEALVQCSSSSLFRSAVDDDAGAVDWRVRLPQRRDDPIAPALRRAQVDEQHLVLTVIDDRRQQVPAAGQIRSRQLALEHGVLQMIAKPAHRLVDLGETFVLTDVVGDE